MVSTGSAVAWATDDFANSAGVVSVDQEPDLEAAAGELLGEESWSDLATAEDATEGGSAQVSAIANQKAWAALPKDYQAAFEVAAFESNMRMLAIYDSKNPDAIQRILSSGVKLRWFPKEILDVAYDTTISMLEEISSKDADFKAIYQHYRNFLNKQSSWYRVADHFLDSYSLSRRGR